MKLTIQMILDVLAELDARYLPGGGEGPFTQVNMIAPDLEALQAHTLYCGTAAQVRKIKPERLEGACVVCVGEEEKLRERYASKGLSLIVVPPGHSLSTVCNRLIETFARLNMWERQLDEAILQEQDFQTIVNICRPVFGKNLILLWDNSYNILAYTQDAKVEQSKLEDVIARGYFTKEITDDLAKMNYMKNSLQYSRPTFIAPPNYMNYPFILKTFVAAQRVQYSICIYFSGSQHTQGYEDLFSCFVERLESYILNHLDSHHMRTSRVDRCVADLIENQERGTEYLEDRASILGLKVSGAYRLCRISFQNYSRDQAQYMKMRIKETIGKGVSAIYEETVILLCDMEARSFLSREELEERYRKMCALLPICDAYAAFSSTFFSLSDVGIAFKQATVARQYGRQLDPDSRCYYYRKYYIYHMIDWYSQQFPMEKMYVQKLPLLMGAKSYKGSNFYLLWVYLTHERNISETAKLLYMHRNSVIYRISRIQETLGVNLDDPDVRLRLMISFKILELMDQNVCPLPKPEGEADAPDFFEE